MRHRGICVTKIVIDNLQKVAYESLAKRVTHCVREGTISLFSSVFYPVVVQPQTNYINNNIICNGQLAPVTGGMYKTLRKQYWPPSMLIVFQFPHALIMYEAS